jgi:predicted transcriptional regulator
MSIATSVKDEARRLVETLPGDASWEDLMYRVYVRQTVEAGLRDFAEGRTVSHEDICNRFAPDINP